MTKYLVLLAALAAGSAQAWNCKYEKDLDVTLDVNGSERLTVVAAAGDLRITGQAGAREARAHGRVCVSEEEWLEEAEIFTEGGRDARLAVVLPSTDGGWNVMGNRYAYMDLEIEVPADLALEVRDTSGDMEIRGTGALEVEDSSGDIDIENVGGDVVLEDSSGSIELVAIDGDVLVRRDSSGDIHGRDIRGSVRVERDSSGEIRFRDVRDDFVVERDSSGDIVADTVGGDFRVESDGSGDVVARNVSGKVETPERG